jgi:type IV pilus assembly protein PilY1
MNILKDNAPKIIMAALLVVGVPLGIWAYTGFQSNTPDNIPIGYIAQDTVTNFNLKDAGGTSKDPLTGVVSVTAGLETLYRTEYNRETWSGNLHAYPIDAAGNLYATKRWSAATRLTNQTLNNGWDSGRFIATLSSAGAGIGFRGALVADSSINGTSYTGSQIVDYLRGDTSRDAAHGGQLRIRNSPLGDIVHSRPFYVDDDSNPTVFVGSNDGMLHAFNADTGDERWAYVPSMLLGKMQKLAYNPADAAQPYKHEYYVDGMVNVGTIKNSAGTASIRALFGSLGAGGNGLYALDVSTLSNPANEAAVASKILWEITPTAIKRNGVSTATTVYSRLGASYGLPVLAKINTSTGTTPSYVDALIVGSGYGDGDGGTGKAHLYVINALTGDLMRDFVVGPYSTFTGANGIFNPKVIDANNDDLDDTVYAADLNGSLWKFDLSAAWTSTASWSSPTAPMFSSGGLPVTSSLGVAAHPKGGQIITFGTGSTLSGAYGVYANGAWTTAGTNELKTSSPDWNYIYGIWDGAPGTGTAVPANLLTQVLTERLYGTTRVRRVTANVPNWGSGGHRGWMVKLPIAGERVVGEGSFNANGRFYFNSYNPTVAPYVVPGTSTSIYGENWLMELNYLTGGSSTAPFLDLDNNILLNDNDRIRYTDTETRPTGKNAGDPILSPSEDGIVVGKVVSTGVQSQPILVQLATLNTTLLNQNPDVIYPATTTLDRGVAGGHFDVDLFRPSVDCTNLDGLGAKATGTVTFSFSSGNNNYAVSVLTIKVGSEVVYSGTNIGNYRNSTLVNFLDGKSSANYVLKKDSNNGSRIVLTAINNGSAYNGAVTVTLTTAGSKPGYSKADVSGGANAATTVTASSSTQCDYSQHDHEYDDTYDKTGVNFLNASNSAFNLSNAIPSTATEFKVLLMNQYLNPAMQLNIGHSDYAPSSANGYTSVKNYQTSPGTASASVLQLSAVPTYTRSNIGSLVLNMPVNAFSISNWWGSTTPDSRVGVMSTSPQCVFYGLIDSGGGNAATDKADLYNPVNPPTNGQDGAGSPSNNPGARHNGAITLQVIRADTPQGALEENLPGRPEYGYRISSAYYFGYVLAEYAIYWHHPRRVCFGDANTTWYNGNSGGNGYNSKSSGTWNVAGLMTGTGWTKNPPADTNTGTASDTPASGSTDPKLGTLGQSGGAVTTSVTSVVGNVSTTTTTYVDGSMSIVVTTSNSNGTSTIVTTQKNSEGQTVGTPTTVNVADAAGTVKTGGDERGTTAKTGRISWRELIRP